MGAYVVFALLVIFFINVSLGALSVVIYPKAMVEHDDKLTAIWNSNIDTSHVLSKAWGPNHLAQVTLDGKAPVYFLARYGEDSPKEGESRWSFDLSPVILKIGKDPVVMELPDAQVKRFQQILGGRKLGDGESIKFEQPSNPDGETKWGELLKRGRAYLAKKFPGANVEHLGFALAKGDEGKEKSYMMALVPEAYNEIGHHGLPTDTKIYHFDNGEAILRNLNADGKVKDTIGGNAAPPRDDFMAFPMYTAVRALPSPPSSPTPSTEQNNKKRKATEPHPTAQKKKKTKTQKPQSIIQKPSQHGGGQNKRGGGGSGRSRIK